MRTIRWSSFLVLSAATVLVAATATAGAVGFGFKGGLSVATLRGSLPSDAVVQNSSKLGLGVGAWVAIPLGPTLSLQPELNYVQKGTSLGSIDLTDPFGAIIGTAEVLEAVDYLELPVLLRVSFPGAGRLSPYLVGGPVVGFLMSQQLRITGTISFGTDIDFFKSTDLGAALGAGLELGRGPFRGTFETRYTMGLTSAGENLYSSDARNGAFLITLGLAIRR
jgi:hypothetical protein